MVCYSNPPGSKPTFLPSFKFFLKLLLEAASTPQSFKINPVKGISSIKIDEMPVILQKAGSEGKFMEETKPAAKTLWGWKA